MPLKRPPVYSPVSLRALLAGALALVGDGERHAARAESLVRTALAPRELLLTDSGTGALTLALLAARRRAEASGREALVALPAYACFDLATAAVGADVDVVFYDVDPRTLGPDWASLDRALAAGPCGVVAAHLYGVPVDVRRMQARAADTGTVLIDDAAQGVGATLGSRPLGTAGALGILSFGRGKGRTGGGGGALIANDADGAALLASVRPACGRAERGSGAWLSLAAQWALGRPSVYWLPAALPFLGLGETPYHAPHHVSGIPPACAAALVSNWSVAERAIAERRRSADARRSRLPAGWAIPEPEAADAVRGELRLAALVPEGASGAEVAASFGGDVMPGYPSPLPVLPALQGRIRGAASFPGAEALATRLVTVATWPGMA